MLYLAIVDKLNRAGFVVAPYNTPEEVPSVKSVSGPARHVGEADKRVRDSRGGSPCGENRCGIGECREGEGTRGAPQERAKLTRTIFYILRSEVSSIEKYDAPQKFIFEKFLTNFGGPGGRQAERTPYSSCFPHLHQTEGVRLGQDGSNIATCRGTRDLIVRLKLFKNPRRQSTVRRETTGHQQDHVRPHRYQVERCAGPVEVQRASE